MSGCTCDPYTWRLCDRCESSRPASTEGAGQDEDGLIFEPDIGVGGLVVTLVACFVVGATFLGLIAWFVCRALNN